jgi:hypothetical protein
MRSIPCGRENKKPTALLQLPKPECSLHGVLLLGLRKQTQSIVPPLEKRLNMLLPNP